MNSATANIRLSSGHNISYVRFGMPGGIPAFYFHGIPGSRFEAELFDRACQKHNIELVAPDRFGYGYSTPELTDRYRCWARCIDELANDLGFAKFYLLAVSGGAPYALACASELADRVIGSAICSGLGPASNVALRRRISPVARLAMLLARSSPLLLKASFGFITRMAAKYAAWQSIGLLGMLNGEPDKSALADTYIRRIVARDFQHAYAQGSTGGVADLIYSNRDWDFDLTRIRSLHLWHGERDKIVPLSHSQWIAKHTPNTTLNIVPGEGHISLPVNQAERIVQILKTVDGEA